MASLRPHALRGHFDLRLERGGGDLSVESKAVLSHTEKDQMLRVAKQKAALGSTHSAASCARLRSKRPAPHPALAVPPPFPDPRLPEKRIVPSPRASAGRSDQRAGLSSGGLSEEPNPCLLHVGSGFPTGNRGGGNQVSEQFPVL